MITLRGIEKIYPLKGGPFYALRNISLTINEGEFVSIRDGLIARVWYFPSVRDPAPTTK